MGKLKIGLQLDVSFLEELSNTKCSGVSIQKTCQHMVLHPMHLKNISGSIKDLLNLGVAKFDKKLGGILLGYRNIKLISKKGIIHNDSCGIHVDLEGEFFVFKPEIGKEMLGLVNRTGKDFIGVLVYNTFNVSIPKTQNEDSWLGQQVHNGCEVMFQIQHVDTSLHLPYIRGELLSIVSKPEKEMSNISENAPTKGRNIKKVLFDNSEANNQANKLIKDEPIENTQDKKAKKKNKKSDKNKSSQHSSVQEMEKIDPKILDNTKKSKKRRATVDMIDTGEYSFSDSVKKHKRHKNSDIPA